MWRDERHVRYGLIAFQKFYLQVMRCKKVKTFEEFMHSSYYAGFVRFGKHLEDLNAIDADGFIDFLLKKEKLKLDDWCSDSLYSEWVRELSRKESSSRALERNLLLMEKWARDHETDWTNFFREVSPQLATKWIETGKLSPWLLYTKVGMKLMDRLSDEQLMLVKEMINPMYWRDKFKEERAEMDVVEQVLKDAGL